MHHSVLSVSILSGFVCICACIHVVFDLNGWKAVRLDNKKVVDSMIQAADHIGGTLKEPVTAFEWIKDTTVWDLYRVSFKAIFPQEKGYECHADVLWMHNPANLTVFNTECMAITLNRDLYGGVRKGTK
ncbi:insoluble matrix shell protein 2-like [Mercenaria mercenaria]|uniref:insoluble matrix shell protein 2-like n=1 Tax=Mercenaria mercenaria TaxID=6596 RepID=UPI00234EE8C9|nr:insoluble matrix shell protein 2-like [Mercenaria mercenaria]